MKIKSVQSAHPCKSLPSRQAGVIQTFYDIVKAHGGELKVETLSAEAAAQGGKESEGSTFIIWLPMV